MVGLESGSQAMLDWMKKDVKLEQVFVTAEKCRRHGIGVLFNLIVGFPDEPPESVAATLAVAKALRAFGPDFQVALFYYRPYPGTPITDDLARARLSAAAQPREWAAIERRQLAESLGGSPASARSSNGSGSISASDGRSRPPGGRRFRRWRAGAASAIVYAFPIEKAIAEWMRPSLAS